MKQLKTNAKIKRQQPDESSICEQVVQFFNINPHSLVAWKYKNLLKIGKSFVRN
jgi:N-acetylglucosamine kinase-like BadF-type ATPase